ncbi:hypothetical protein KSP40_PGU015130 [Platanthera guangdongensis]|uniref:Uncharacterized protein n=1 Tax=Platanthera guangdongensis TaxID=2320717 RepID=A0ABR2LBT8_9ASPA
MQIALRKSSNGCFLVSCGRPIEQEVELGCSTPAHGHVQRNDGLFTPRFPHNPIPGSPDPLQAAPVPITLRDEVLPLKTLKTSALVSPPLSWCSAVLWAHSPHPSSLACSTVSFPPFRRCYFTDFTTILGYNVDITSWTMMRDKCSEHGAPRGESNLLLQLPEMIPFAKDLEYEASKENVSIWIKFLKHRCWEEGDQLEVGWLHGRGNRLDSEKSTENGTFKAGSGCHNE